MSLLAWMTMGVMGLRVLGAPAVIARDPPLLSSVVVAGRRCDNSTHTLICSHTNSHTHTHTIIHTHTHLIKHTRTSRTCQWIVLETVRLTERFFSGCSWQMRWWRSTRSWSGDVARVTFRSRASAHRTSAACCSIYSLVMSCNRGAPGRCSPYSECKRNRCNSHRLTATNNLRL